MNPKYHLITFGCQMNKNDSERIESVLERLGMEPTSLPEEADLILLNTCSVRQSAEDRVYGRVENFNKLKKKKPGLIIGITGCMAGRDTRGDFLKKMPGVDLYFSINSLSQLPKLIHRLNPDISSRQIPEDYLKIIPKYHNQFQSFVTISTGCDKFCSYCVVPYARGRVRHRPVKDIVGEARHLCDNGCLEITLLGQIVNNYIAPDPENFTANNPFKDNFAALLWEINQLSGLERLNWTSPHPSYMSDEVIEAMTLSKQLNYLHLPVQSGSDEVLSRMNRSYTRDQYLEIMEKIKKARPGIALGADIIVGFPGETERQFEETLDLYQQVDFDISYNAMYSPRSGTAAAKSYPDDVPHQTKKERWQRLEALMESTTLRKNQAYQGREVSVLVERWRDNICQGHSNENKLVEFCSRQDLTGTIQGVIIKSPQTWILRGNF
jgi:tRNA-2-methylthio-N6-dimethylallyladenosine synthase